jgi:hypothetical protein
VKVPVEIQRAAEGLNRDDATQPAARTHLVATHAMRTFAQRNGAIFSAAAGLFARGTGPEISCIAAFQGSL